MNLSAVGQEENPNIIKYLEEAELSSTEDNMILKEMQSFTKEQFFYLISISSSCERYDDVLLAFEYLFAYYQSAILFNQERIILETALKQTVSLKQKKLNKLDHLYNYSQNKASDLEDFENHELLLNGIKSEKERISKETECYLKRILHIIEEFIMKTVTITNKGIDREVEVFYFRMKGDIYKYFSQVEYVEEIKLKALAQAKDYYNDAYKLGGQFLPISNKVYLSTVLSYANFLLFFLKNKSEAGLIIQKVVKNDFIKDVMINKSNIQLEIFDIVKEIYDLNEALVSDSIVLTSEGDEYNLFNSTIIYHNK